VHVVVFPAPCNPTNIMTLVFFVFGSYGFSCVSTNPTNSSNTAFAMYRFRFEPAGRFLKSTLCLMDLRSDWTSRTLTSDSRRAAQISLSVASNC
jgi:hypothetical protein